MMPTGSFRLTSKIKSVGTENVDLIEISKRISDHHEKTGTVLVGMHTELQEQKARLRQHEVRISGVVSALESQVETIVTKASSKMNEAILGLDNLRPVIDDARESLDKLHQAGTQWSNDAERLRELHAEAQSEFLGRAEVVLTEVIKPFVERISTEVDRIATQQHSAIKNTQEAIARLHETLETAQSDLDSHRAQLVEDLSLAVKQASNGLRSVVNEEFNSLVKQLKEQSKLHLEQSSKARDQFSRSMEAAQGNMARLMLVHREAVADEFKEIKLLASSLNTAAEAHSRQVSDFARRARNISLGSAGLIVFVVFLMLYLRPV